MEKIRLQKFCSEIGFCSRRTAEDLICKKKILINGKLATLGDRVSGDEEILVNGEILKKKKPKKIFIAFHKPVNVESTCAKMENVQTLDDFVFPARVFPIGRLDKDSRGLLLLTNDGEMANRLAHPSFGHEKEYFVTVDRPISGSALKKIEAGFVLEDDKISYSKTGRSKFKIKKKTLPCRAEKLEDNIFRLVLKEGRNRQIRRMCEALGMKVIDLYRARVENIFIGELPEGKFRVLSAAEVQAMKKR
jgi:23S rRNA pseudouridine2604 synthase